MKKLLMPTLLAVLALSGNVNAHDAKPKHGGIVQSANDLSFELVAKGDNATIHVEDHGKPFSTTGATGKLTVLNKGQKAETALQPGANGTLEAKGVSNLTAGAKAVATINLANKETFSVRFSMK